MPLTWRSSSSGNLGSGSITPRISLSLSIPSGDDVTRDVDRLAHASSDVVPLLGTPLDESCASAAGSSAAITTSLLLEDREMTGFGERILYMMDNAGQLQSRSSSLLDGNSTAGPGAQVGAYAVVLPCSPVQASDCRAPVHSAYC